MKKSRNIITVLFLSLAILFFSCNKEEFTEADILKMEEETDLTVFVQDPLTGDPVGGAKVSLTQDGKQIEAATGLNGEVYFKDVKAGKVPVSITKDGYIAINRTLALSDDYRSRNHTEVVNFYSLEGEGTGIVRGKARIQTDLTTAAYEYASGAVVRLTLYDATAYNYEDDEYYHKITTLTTSVDVNGNYSFKIPASLQGNNIRFSLSFDNFQTDQKLKADKDNDGTKEIVTAKTIFVPFEDAIDIPSDPANISASSPIFLYPNGKKLNDQYAYYDYDYYRYAPIKKGQIFVIDVDFGTGNIREIQ